MFDKGYIAVSIGHVLIPPGSVCNHGQGSHEEREEEEGDEGCLHLSCPACSPWRLAVLGQADLRKHKKNT